MFLCEYMLFFVIKKYNLCISIMLQLNIKRHKRTRHFYPNWNEIFNCTCGRSNISRTKNHNWIFFSLNLFYSSDSLEKKLSLLQCHWIFINVICGKDIVGVVDAFFQFLCGIYEMIVVYLTFCLFFRLFIFLFDRTYSVFKIQG